MGDEDLESDEIFLYGGSSIGEASRENRNNADNSAESKVWINQTSSTERARVNLRSSSLVL